MDKGFHRKDAGCFLVECFWKAWNDRKKQDVRKRLVANDPIIVPVVAVARDPAKLPPRRRMMPFRMTGTSH